MSNKYLVQLYNGDEYEMDALAFVEITPKILKQIEIAKKHVSAFCEDLGNKCCEIKFPNPFQVYSIEDLGEIEWENDQTNGHTNVEEFPPAPLEDNLRFECDYICVHSSSIDSEYLDFYIEGYGKYNNLHYSGTFYVKKSELAL